MQPSKQRIATPPQSGFQFASFDALTPPQILNALPSNIAILSHSHLMSGIHTKIQRPFSYITIIRDPIAHIISEFCWSQGIEFYDLSYHARIERLERYLFQFDHLNHQAFVISEPVDTWPVLEAHPHPDNLRQSPDMLLKNSIEKINNSYIFAGITEYSDTTFKFFEDFFGFADLKYSENNFRNISASGRFSSADLPRSIHDRLQSCVHHDLELYDYILSINSVTMRKLREESTNIIHDVRHDVFEVRKKSDYDCKLDVVWDDFIEGLLAIGARASQENETWVLDFSFPIVLEETIDLVVQINILSFTKNGRACPLRCMIHIGSCREDIIIHSCHKITMTTRKTDLVNNTLPFHLSATPVSPDDRDVYLFNPLPFMIPSILVSKLPLCPLDTFIAFDDRNHDMLIEGWETPEGCRIPRSISRKARIAISIETATLQQNGIILALTVSPIPMSGQSGWPCLCLSVNGKTVGKNLTISQLTTIRVPINWEPCDWQTLVMEIRVDLKAFGVLLHGLQLERS
jgi:hypothetical protein